MDGARALLHTRLLDVNIDAFTSWTRVGPDANNARISVTRRLEGPASNMRLRWTISRVEGSYHSLCRALHSV